MNRYFLYLILLNMMINVIIFVPKILIQYRYEGAVSAVLIAIPIGVTLTVLYCKAISKFPEKGLPEIFENTKYRFIKILHFGSIQAFTFIAGLITLVGFIDILSRFIDPEMPKVFILIIYLIGIILIIQMPTERVMYFLEIVLFLNTPLIFFIIFKALTSNGLSWDSMFEVGTHLFEFPNLKALAAATYVFSGYTNLMVFNRVIKGKLKIWNFIAVFLLGFFNLFTTFLIPIGFHGSDGTQEFLYPWISTADSLRLVYSPIERVIFLFLMFYMSITLVSISVHWHVALELLKGTFKDKGSKKKEWIILSLFIVCAVTGVLYFNTVLLNKFTVYWLQIRFYFEVALIVIFFLWARRKKA
ncbi:GerAB/ArcD/ProY family transporter [Bacillus sp. UNC438CL73TsuS30]|uniref:GerAB/ArcD/ProY family transporter n=1 Tax=Bacillus sp. UNC438CL73TsuS30 TaxID=1340434 RepID=UPI00047B6E39|nr:GerAB/ArcD/ProY family transporter [Bacillus sp. UNC438CL73TsuS30]